ncbi:DUF2267 domain-containing protein [Chryseotalea sanaruensis]|nr:DUF2267 domain-containing protein [Chryseotalea sanaruensis]
MPLDFEKFVAKGNEFINSLDHELGNKGREYASRILRSVFRAIRSKLSVSESIDLISQLPMALKAVYVDGWKPVKDTQPVFSIYDLSDEIIRQDGLAAWRDFSGRDEAIVALKAVMKTLSNYVSFGEMRHVIAIFPSPVKEEMMELIKPRFQTQN